MYRGGGKPGRLSPGSGGSRRKGQTYVDWFKQNFCVHCQKTCIKGTIKCPDCHLKVRVVPHNHRSQRILYEVRRKLIKKAQEEATLLLSKSGWILPPASVPAK